MENVKLPKYATFPCVNIHIYVCFRMVIKGTPPCGNFNPVLSAGKLTQQLIVDYYCRIEGDRLKYIRNQQSKLRVDSYSGLADSLRATANGKHYSNDVYIKV